MSWSGANVEVVVDEAAGAKCTVEGQRRVEAVVEESDAEVDAVRAIEDEVQPLLCQNQAHVGDEGILRLGQN
jgi:hypothetical protein